MLEIKNIYVSIEGKEILKDFSLAIHAGEIHAIMGPNGAGKSTLAKVLAGDPSYSVDSGEIWFKGQNILELAPEERAHLGLFMSFQYPLEIGGVTNAEFLHAAYNACAKARGKEILTFEAFHHKLEDIMQLMEIKSAFKTRNLNEGFSGGEKKRNEILQMAILEPSLSILDETDSGLDIDAMRVVASCVTHLLSKDRALLLITHYQRLLDYIRPHFVHVMIDGKIVKTGGAELALELEEKGYEKVC